MTSSEKNSLPADKLKHAEEKINRLMENLPGMAYSCRIVPEWTMVILSKGCLTLTGYSPEDLIENKVLSYRDLIHPEDREYVWQNVSAAVNSDVFFELEYRIVKKSGNIRWVWERGQAVYDSDIGCNVLEGFVTDITDRKLAEQRTRDAKNKYEALLNHLQSGVFYINKDGEIKETNVSLIKIMGSPSVEETRKINIFKFQPLIEFGYTGKLKECIDTGNIVYGEGEYKSKWGKKIYIKYYFVPIKTGENVEGVLASIDDISQKKRNEEELQKMQRLESIGTLAGGIAHDFNNLLTSVFGNITFAKMSLAADHTAIKILEQAEKAMDRATGLTRQLLTFSKGGEPLKEVVNISELIKETVKFDLSGSSVRPEIKFSPNLWTVMADRGQLTQVISNIVINAEQSMPDGGFLKITLENIVVNENELGTLDKGKYVKIKFEDDGEGIERKYLEKIFYPYFTTKQCGSGLGLTVVFSVVKKHGGYVSVESELGSGSCFSVYIPAIDASIVNENPEDIHDTDVTVKALKVLVMDDEHSILDLIKDVLESEGHFVETAVDGNSAVMKYKNAMMTGRKFNVVIMDLTIPGGMGGKEAVKLILESDADAKCIVSSGYASDSVMANYETFGFKAAIAKPFRIEELFEVIREVV